MSSSTDSSINHYQQSILNRKQIVLVTGSSGCLGQHIVKLLHEQDDTVEEIRCYDIKPFQNNLKHKIIKEMQIITADIRNERQLMQAMVGVDIVIHCAALVDLELLPNEKELYSVNVEGTQKVFDCAVQCNVPYFIHMSGTDAIIGPDQIYYCSEGTIQIPKRHLLQPYSQTKLESEEFVKESNGRILANGVGKIRTCILRPTLIYGEEDNHFITKILSITKWNGMQLRRIDNVFVRIQPVYVGNVAWACLKAKDKLQTSNIDGEEFIITDDTKIIDPFDFVEPFVKAKGYRLSQRSYPYWLFMAIFSLYCWLIKSLWNIYPIKLPSSFTPSTLQFFCNTYFFNRTKAILRLDYDPLYGSDESQKRSLDYYRKLPL